MEVLALRTRGDMVAGIASWDALEEETAFSLTALPRVYFTVALYMLEMK